jgi:hypothetical protein
VHFRTIFAWAWEVWESLVLLRFNSARRPWVAREAKAVAPPATAWLAALRNSELAPPADDPGAAANSPALRVVEILAAAVRCPDPFFLPGPRWSIRRLAPRCSRIDLETLGGRQTAGSRFGGDGRRTCQYPWRGREGASGDRPRP